MQSARFRATTLGATIAIALITLIACGRPTEVSRVEVTRVTPPNLPEAARQATADAVAGRTSPSPTPPPVTVEATAAPDAAQSSEEPPASTELAFDPDLVVKGETLFSQFACMSCHTTNGQKMSGPPLNGVYGHEVTLTSGETITADADYLRRSILEPDAQVVEGYPGGLMSAVVSGLKPQIEEGDNLDALVAYIASLGDK